MVDWRRPNRRTGVRARNANAPVHNGTYRAGYPPLPLGIGFNRGREVPLARVSTTTDIGGPPEAVWALLSDPHRYPELADPTERMIDVPEEEMEVGYVNREYGGIRPFMSESEWRITVFEPVRRQVHVGDDGQMTFHLDNILEPIDSGTRFTQTLELTPRWYMAPISAVLWPLMMRKRAQAAMDKTGANMKRMIEGS